MSCHVMSYLVTQRLFCEQHKKTLVAGADRPQLYIILALTPDLTLPWGDKMIAASTALSRHQGRYRVLQNIW